MAVVLLGASSFKPEGADTFPTSAGKLTVTLLGHASLLFQVDGKNIYVDPCKAFMKQENLPKADIVIVTHNHFDHLDAKEIEQLSSSTTVVVAPEQCSAIKPTVILKNGQKKTISGIVVEAVPAYNIQHKNEKGELFHPKGDGNGYVITIGGKRFYVAGDTEDIPEMASLKKIDVAFLPVNLPYTMDATMFEHAVKMVKPTIVYPYHYKGTDLTEVKKRLKGIKGVEVRIRNIY